jgi:hypothetical protein
MSECCTTNAPPGGRRQGRDCPVNAARAARTCEALGICQHPSRECTGACEQTPQIPAMKPTTAELWQRFCFWGRVVVVGLGSLIVLCGFAGYLWVRWHQI